MKNQDVTPLFSAYRECARHVWNTNFANKPLSFRDIDLLNRADRILFSVMVLSKINNDEHPGFDPARGFMVSPRFSPAPVMMNREIPPAGYWDHPADKINRDDVALKFQSFFDWDDFGCRDFQYIKFVCEESRGDAIALKGRQGLIDWNHVRIEVRHDK